MNKSDSIGNLAAALSKAQAEFPPIPKDKEVLVKSDKGNYKFSYAPLESITGAIRPVLAANGLAFTQSVGGDSLTTTILHSSGEWLQGDPIPVKVASGSAQALGSGITYARRYSLTCAFGIVADEDDDGNTADGNHVETVKKPAYKGIPANVGGLDHVANADATETAALNASFSLIQGLLNEGNPGEASKAYFDLQADNTERAAGLWSMFSKDEQKAISKNNPRNKT